MSDEITRSASIVSKSRPIVVALLLIALPFTAFMHDPTARMVAQIAMIGVFSASMFWMLVGVSKAVHEELGSIAQTMRSVDATVRSVAAESRTPPTFDRFEMGHKAIEAKIDQAIAGQKKVKLQVIAVTGKYSCIFINDNLDRWAERLGSDGEIVVQYALISDVTLERHEQKGSDWDQHRSLTLTTLRQRASMPAKPSSAKVIVERIDYDDLPHIHGILINDHWLYQGRTLWEFGRDGSPELRVGQTPYRVYTTDDGLGGQDRIQRFQSWFRYYLWYSARQRQRAGRQSPSE